MSDLTWYRVQQEIRDALESDLRNGNLDPDRDRDELADEYADADADAYGFTYHYANTLWMAESDFREFEDDAVDLDYAGAATIQDRICIVVTLALRSAYREALDEILDESAANNSAEEVPA